MFQFLKLQPEAFGLDISDLSIKVAQLKRKGRSFTLASFADVPLEKGSIEKGEVKKEENLVQALEKIKTSTKGKKISSPYAIVSLPEERAFLEVIQLPAMEVKDLDQAVRFEAENYIPYSMDTVYVDYSLQVSPEKSSHMDVLIASLPRQIVDSYLHFPPAID
ncbi:MAG: pilus assembly protein PilM [Candidatus Wildermuthbacteria bacterium]|nr:pilus assembly protein PilM [Candidatus Wildermuthbacteria bacterium]